MEKILDVADYMIQRYFEITKEALDELKLHNLLYFAQRESFAVSGEPLFEEDLEGWSCGPISRDVRTYFVNGEIAAETGSVGDKAEYVVSNVIMEYGSFANWKLGEMARNEVSWNNSKENHGLIKKDDIQKDSEKVRPFDHVWDMYVDEFEDDTGR